MSIRDNHRGGVVRARMAPGTKFAVVPRELLEDQRLGLAARAVASWLGSHSEDWQIAIPPMRRVLGLSEFRWLSVAKELEAAGYLTRERTRPKDAHGQWVWDIVFDHERGLAQAARDAKFLMDGGLMDGGLMDGELAHGKPGDKEEEKGLKKKSGKEKREAREHEADQPQGTARRAGGGGKGQARQAPGQAAEGIWYCPGDPRDEAALGRIRGFEPSAVEAAVAEALAVAPQAWPAAVLAILLRMRKASAAAAARARPEHAQVPPPIEPTPAQQVAAAAARAAASEKLSKLQKKMVIGK